MKAPFALFLLLTLAALPGRADEGFTLNAEVLERYGYTLDGYNAMSAPQKRQCEEWIKALEDERKKAAARAALLPAPKAPEKSPTLGEGWSEDQHKSFARLKSAAGGSSFDGAPKSSGGGLTLTPHLELYGPARLRGDGTQDGGVVRRLELDTPLGTLQAGQLGAAGQNPLVMPSPYFGVAGGGEGSGRLLDYSWAARGYMLGLGARLYNDDAPALDRRIDQGINSLYSLDPVWGIKPGEIDNWKRSLSFSTDPETAWMFYGSAMGRVGRAYSLLPRVDVGWSAMGVARVAGVFPNLALDQTVGARIKADEKTNIGVFGGVTETPGLFPKTFIADGLEGDKWKTNVQPTVDVAPHAQLVAWGRMPYLSNVQYQVGVGQQWNPWTTVQTVAGGAKADMAGGKSIGVFGKYDSETSPADMEFSRKKASAGVTFSPTPGVETSASYFQDNARFGSASMDSRGVWLGLTIEEKVPGGKGRGPSVTMTSLLGGRQSFVSQDKQSEFVQGVQSLLDLGRGLSQIGLDAGGGPENSWKNLKAAWDKLDPSVKKLIGDAWAEYNPGAPSLDRILAVKPDDIGTLNRFIDLVTDTRVLERLVVRYLRNQLLDEMKEVEIPILGKTKLSAPLVIAAAHAYGLAVSPLPPITEKDAREHLDPFLMRKLSKKLDCAPGDGPQADQTYRCIMDKIPEGTRKKMEEAFGDSLPSILKGAVSWPSDIIRREMNMMVLKIILAAETLNELSVDQGERIGDLNVRGMMQSFAYLDKRGHTQVSAVLKGAAKRVEEELAEQDRKMRAELSEYGSARLSWLHAQDAWPKNVRIAVRSADWPSLLAVYGDAKLFDFILKAKAKMEAASGGKQSRLMIGFDPNGTFGTTTITGDPMEVRLGPKPVDLAHVELPLK